MDQQNNLNPIMPEQPTGPMTPQQEPPQPISQPTVQPSAAPMTPQTPIVEMQQNAYQPPMPEQQPTAQPYQQSYQQPYQQVPYQPQQYNPYAPMQYQMMPIEQTTPKSGLSMAALITGILGLALCMPFPCSILALIFGIIGYRANKQGTALAGIILGAIGVAILAFLAFCVVIAMLDGAYYYDEHWNEYARFIMGFLR